MEEKEQRWKFPLRINSYEVYEDAALEFVKFVCEHIFSLDQSFYKEAIALRKNLLRKIELKEFAPETREALEPALVLVLPDVICKECTICQDLDLCRDHQLNQEVWNCYGCGSQLDRQEIEKRLISVLNRKVVQYQLLDQRCKKCKMIKNHLVSKVCECTGTYQQVLGHKMPKDLKNKNMLNSQASLSLTVTLLRNFASLHDMPVLQEVSQQFLDVC
jgi:DNA polymerase epsilon subunit 1